MSDYDVELRRVTKRFGQVIAVDDVSFGIRRGEFFSLLGPSGCGKTTIMRMISGFETPTRGEVFIAGEAMAARPPYRRPTNLVFQHLSLFPHMTVFQNIAFGLEMKWKGKAEIRDRVERMFALIQLPGFAERKISQLSGGQKQRIAIARALVNEPTVLLLDEPLGALDLKLREQMQLELKRIQREVGTTFVYVTHDQKEAITMSNRIAVMDAGRVEQIDDATTIYERPRTPFVAGFIGETNLFRGRLVDSGTVACEAIAIRTGAADGAGAGAPVHVSVRPEKVRIGSRAEALPNAFTGAVDEVVYQGATTTYRVDIGGGLDVLATVQNAEVGRLYDRGDRIAVGWEPEAAVVIPETAP